MTASERETREQRIKRLVDKAPPLTADQRNRLAILLRPASPPIQPRAETRKARGHDVA